MKTKRTKRMAVAATLLLLVGTGVVTASVNNDFAITKNLQIFFSIFKNTVLMYVDDVDPKQLIDKASQAMLSSLDPYTEYLPEEEMKEFEILTTGKYGGTGALIGKAQDTAYVRIVDVYENFPAHKAGLIPGDIILSIDGKEMKGLPISTVSDAMKGEPGSSYSMTIMPLRAHEPRSIDIKRQRIKISAIPYHGYLAKGIGYIPLQDFSEGCGKEFKEAFNDLKSDGELQTLIIDLRNNGGGLLQESINILALFLPKGSEVVSTKGKMTQEDKIYKTNENPIDLNIPIVVLVNENTASSSEIVAGALQDMDRGVVMGRKTFGKGVIQTTRSVGYGGFIKVTTAKYYIPSGRCIQALDYTHPNKQGQASLLPDSSKKAFKTSKGRVVYDGGGIAPDVPLAKDSVAVNKFVISLFRDNYLSNFAIEYFKQHPTAVPVDYRMSDADYDLFCTFMKNSDLKFTPDTRILIDRLAKTSKEEYYYDDLAQSIETMKQIFDGQITKDLQRNKEVLKSYLEPAIVDCYYFPKERFLHSIKKDKELQKAIDFLQTPNAYSDVLSNTSSIDAVK